MLNLRLPKPGMWSAMVAVLSVINGGWNEEMQKRKMSMFMIFMDAKEVRGMR
jgi:hypothetical protein